MADEFKPIAGPRPGGWKFPVDEEAEEWLRQSRDEVPKMPIEDQMRWHTKYLRWLDAQCDD